MPSEGLILAFDTSAAHCAAALLRGDRLLAGTHEDMAKGQAERLMPLLEELLAQGGAGWGDLSAIGVGIGPGNFTGVRISVAAARGLALAARIPAYGVSTLEALALGATRPCRVLADARRDEVYTQLFTENGVFSPGLVARADLPQDALLIEAPALPLAEAIARIAAARLVAGEAAARPAPLYLRAADAAPPRGAPPRIIS